MNTSGSTSLMVNDESTLNHSVNVSDMIGVSPIGSSYQNKSSTIASPSANYLPVIKDCDDMISEEEMAHLVIFESFFELIQKFFQEK